jgi:hypothetical protein
MDKFVAPVIAQAAQYPPIRDTILSEKYQFMIVAFIADNPGVWALHCNNDFHARSGMFKQIVEAPNALRANLGTWNALSDGTFSWHTANANFKDKETVMQVWQRNVLQCYAK